jgi:hypothetical protein
VDKALLATALVGVGLVANRLLESHKARETLRATLAGERLPRIREAMEKLEDLRYRSNKMLDVIFWTANRYLRNKGESGDPTDVAVAAQPIEFGNRALFDAPFGAVVELLTKRALHPSLGQQCLGNSYPEGIEKCLRRAPDSHCGRCKA